MESATARVLQAALGDSYTLERELGRGGMATVYLARDLRRRRSVAVKVLHPELSALIGPERFFREIEDARGKGLIARSPSVMDCVRSRPGAPPRR